MVEYSKVNVKLTETVVKDKIETTRKMIFKMLNGNDLPHELLLTTRHKTKLRNVFNNNMSTDLKLSKARISIIIQSILGSILSKLTGLLMKVAIYLAINLLAPLGITAAASAIDTGILKKYTWFRNNNINSFKRRNE